MSGSYAYSLFFSNWIQFLELIPGMRDRETPIDSCPASFPFRFPGTGFAYLNDLAAQHAIYTLFGQNRNFDYPHDYVTAILGRLVQPQFTGQVSRLLRRKSLVNGSGCMGI
jgi:hypothetical protein